MSTSSTTAAPAAPSPCTTVSTPSGSPALTPAPSQTRHERTGRALRETFVQLGPTYVKLAQLLSSSPGLFPPSITDELRPLLDQVPPAPIDTIRELISAELGAPPEELFVTFDPQPLASASIAQVHAATLADGQQVVVKVQRPGIRGRLAADVRLLHHGARGLERASRLGRMANAVGVVEDFAATLDDELNFVTEARSMERWSANLARSGGHDGVRTPRVHWPLTTARVLTMERVDGIPDRRPARRRGRRPRPSRRAP
ncbi:hypothetical protein GKE82_26480 [Conexibacter sp. W3-3-2]|nr:hypothetical protein [Conexibacter sp. W3-3-2]